MTILHSDLPLSIEDTRHGIEILDQGKTIRVNGQSLYQGEGYGFVISKKYLPGINTTNAMQMINNLLRHKQTPDYHYVVVIFHTGKTPFMVADHPHHKNLLVMV